MSHNYKFHNQDGRERLFRIWDESRPISTKPSYKLYTNCKGKVRICITANKTLNVYMLHSCSNQDTTAVSCHAICRMKRKEYHAAGETAGAGQRSIRVLNATLTQTSYYGEAQISTKEVNCSLIIY